MNKFKVTMLESLGIEYNKKCIYNEKVIELEAKDTTEAIKSLIIEKGIPIIISSIIPI